MKKLITFIFLLSNAVLIFANGGPIDGSYIHKTGNIRLIEMADIKLISEKLHITVDGDYCHVKVDYVLKNQSEAKNVKYGFPVDYYAGERITDIDFLVKQAQEQFENYYRKDYITYFRIYDNDEQLNTNPHKTSKKYTSKVWKSRINKYDYDDDSNYSSTFHLVGEYDVSRQWYLTEISFESKERKKISVEYSVRSSYNDWEYGDYLYYSKRRFSYDLTPSKHWGDGILADFQLDIEFLEDITFQGDNGFFGIDNYTTTNNGYQLHTTNFDLNQDQILHLIYDNKCLKTTEFMQKGLLQPNIKTSTSPNISTILDGNLTTTYQMSISENPILIETEDIDFKQFGLIASRSVNAKLKISVLFSPFNTTLPDEWESFMVNLKSLEPITENEIETALGCKINILKKGHWDGESFRLKALKIEILEHQSGLEQISLPEFIFIKV